MSFWEEKKMKKPFGSFEKIESFRSSLEAFLDGLRLVMMVMAGTRITDTVQRVMSELIN